RRCARRSRRDRRSRRPPRANGVTLDRRAALLTSIAPAVVVFLASAAIATLSHRSPTRLTLDLAWAPPSAARPFGSGEAGVDVLAVVSHGTFRALCLAVGVTAFGFAVGVPF